MPFRLIALDLDGTVLNSRKEITPRTREVLAAARARGIVTVIATGRTPQSALYFSRQIGGGPVICCNGAAILDESGAMAVARSIPRAPLGRLLELCRETRVVVECYTPGGIVLDRPLELARIYLAWVRPRLSLVQALMSLASHSRLNRIRPVRSLLKWWERPDLPPVLKLMVLGEREQLAALARRISREMPGLEVSSSGPDNLEIMASGVSKGSGLELLGARLKIPREAILAFGDAGNDREMLRYAGLGVAMGNASDEIKAIAGRVTATCDEDGVARVVEEICLT